MSHPELSSGGGSSLSSGKLSKLLVSVGDATCGGKSKEKGMFIPGLAFPLHPTAMGIPENPQQGREVLLLRGFPQIPYSPEFSYPLAQGYHDRLGKRAQDFPSTDPGC